MDSPKDKQSIEAYETADVFYRPVVYHPQAPYKSVTFLARYLIFKRKRK